MKKIIILFTSLLLLSCSNDDNSSSNQIPTGSDSVSLIFDNQEFSTTNKNTSFEKIHVYVSPFDSFIVFMLSNNEKAVEVSISSQVGFEEGKTYAINGRQTSNVSGRLTYYSTNSATKWASTNNEIGGAITIEKLDYEKRIIAATFEFDAAEENGTMHTIRNGWFDLKF
ncbi:hypothetical protein [Flavobacterium sp. I3-2]|uniref:hypothetical protein n=1 Tax=Flavobacterium sp. I3-2 TaxID=2748319 RepID=UPI0015B25EC0|nr:hypothetical protein [Flavobacterium sp. I3-2]